MKGTKEGGQVERGVWHTEFLIAYPGSAGVFGKVSRLLHSD